MGRGGHDIGISGSLSERLVRAGMLNRKSPSPHNDMPLSPQLSLPWILKCAGSDPHFYNMFLS